MIKEELTYKMTLEQELEGSEGHLGEECPWQKDQQVQRPWEQEGGWCGCRGMIKGEQGWT